MVGEKTKLSKFTSTLISEYNIIDFLLVSIFLLTVASVMIPSISPLIGVVLTIIMYGFLYISSYTSEYDIRKFGEYKELYELDNENTCPECGQSKKNKIGYSVYYFAGYELFRIENYRNNNEDCDKCSIQSKDIKIEEEYT